MAITDTLTHPHGTTHPHGATHGTTHSMLSRPIYDRKYPGLKRFSWPWRLLATYASFMTWLASTPWLVVRALAPQNLQDNCAELERGFLSAATPLMNFVQDSTYKAFSIADATTDWAINTAVHIYHNNLKGVEHTFDHVLNNVEHRVRILKDDGLNGITKALALDLPHTGGHVYTHPNSHTTTTTGTMGTTTGTTTGSHPITQKIAEAIKT